MIESTMTLSERPGRSVAAAPLAHPMSEAEFENFYGKIATMLWRYIMRVVGDGAAADDIFQKTFFQFLRTPLRSDEESQLRALCFRIASNLIVDHWRDVRKRRGFDDLMDRIESSSREIDLRADLQPIFQELKPQERALLWLAHVEESSHREIAGSLGVKEKSVKVLLFRARRKLASILRERGLAPEGWK